jgi:hypothetical protein
MVGTQHNLSDQFGKFIAKEQMIYVLILATEMARHCPFPVHPLFRILSLIKMLFLSISLVPGLLLHLPSFHRYPNRSEAQCPLAGSHSAKTSSIKVLCPTLSIVTVVATYSLCFYLPCILGLVKVKLYKVWSNILRIIIKSIFILYKFSIMNVNNFCYVFSQTSKNLTLTITKTQGNKKQRD